MMRPSRVLILLACGALLTPSGCSKQISAPRTTPVEGFVYFQGEPLEGVRVTLHPQFSMDFRPSGYTDEKGRFTLSTASPGDGAPPGEYIVTFDLPMVESDDENSGIEMEVDAWNGQYSNPTSSTWRVTIQAGESRLEPFRID